MNEERNKAICERFKHGARLKTLAGQYNISTDLIRNILRDNGLWEKYLVKRRKQVLILYKGGTPLEEIQAEFGLDKRHLLEDLRFALSGTGTIPELHKEIKRERENGSSIQELASRYLYSVDKITELVENKQNKLAEIYSPTIKRKSIKKISISEYNISTSKVMPIIVSGKKRIVYDIMTTEKFLKNIKKGTITQYHVEPYADYTMLFIKGFESEKAF